jgi:DNA-binding transcriptional ArsR family regulator
VRRTALSRLAEAADDPRSRVQVLAEITRLRRLSVLDDTGRSATLSVEELRSLLAVDGR